MGDATQPLPREALIRLPEVIRYTGLEKTELYSRIADGDFPQAVQLGPRAVAWIWGEVADWNMQRARVPVRAAVRQKTQTSA